jgi:hypothetical protein
MMMMVEQARRRRRRRRRRFESYAGSSKAHRSRQMVGTRSAALVIQLAAY